MKPSRGLRQIGVLVSMLLAIGVPVALSLRSGVPLRSLLALSATAHLFAAGVMGIEVMARAARLKALAPTLGVPLRWRTAVFSQLAADAAGAVTPARSGSEPAKLLSLRRDGATFGAVGALAAAEMIFEVAGLVLVSGFLTLALGAEARLGAGVLIYAGVVAGALTLLALFARATSREVPTTRRKLLYWWLRLGLRRRRWKALVATAQDFRRHTRRLWALRGRPIAGALAATLLHQLARAAVLPALLLGQVPPPELAGLSWVRIVVVPFTLLYLGALLPPPGGGGGVEVGFAALLNDTLNAQQLPAFVLWWRSWTHHATALAGGAALLVLGMRQRLRRRQRRVDSADPYINP